MDSQVIAFVDSQVTTLVGSQVTTLVGSLVIDHEWVVDIMVVTFDIRAAVQALVRSLVNALEDIQAAAL